ncbi:hypothetical protein BXZ70DRAFT_764705 [Cristinia sonorae]|uniref:Uncharacterized protein n=1 Tax=Cristinia sonorae TaxID=1940300 RepID=A0A8K0XS29_9AGAR|nr:hypothetical protein BXZ70DRAFT_764705 [Cristinia sonorae]
MIAIQKPVNPLSTMPYHHRPSHARHPSAPVVVRPTHVPGLLSLSKPVNPPQPRQQPQPRPPRTSPKGKAQRTNQKQEADQPKQPAPKRSEADKLPTTTTAPAATPDKSARGRQPKQASNDQSAGRRSTSLSTRTQARRLPHQPSPPPSTRIPQQSDNSAPLAVNPLRAQPPTNRPSDSNLFDPFVVHTPQDNESPEPMAAKPASNKQATFRAPLQLATRPTGRLARRRQAAVPVTPTPSKAVPVPRQKNNSESQTSSQLSRSAPQGSTTPKRPNARRVSTGPAVPAPVWDSFPICDDSDDVTPPCTPIRESTSVPFKKAGSTTWQQEALFVDDAPRTAPLSSGFTFPFNAAATPTPAQRRRNGRHHQRVPSEGVFAMSADEDSSNSDASEELKTLVTIMKRHAIAPPRKSPSPVADDALPANFYAGSVFQNSPSPEDLPMPAFRA